MPVTHYDYNQNKLVTEYEGRVLLVARETVRVMSDVWEDHLIAHCWDPEKGVVRVYVSGTGSSNDEGSTATVDATQSVLDAHHQWCYSQSYEAVFKSAQREANIPEKGKTLVVTGGLTHPGVTGKAIAVINGNYNMGNRSVNMRKFGIALSDRQGPVQAKNGRTYTNYLDVAWVWERNVVVDNPEQYINQDQVQASALRHADITTARLTLKNQGYA